MWEVKESVGRAKCRICDCIIAKDEKQVTYAKFWGAKSINESVHLSCLNNYDKMRLANCFNCLKETEANMDKVVANGN